MPRSPRHELRTPAQRLHHVCGLPEEYGNPFQPCHDPPQGHLWGLIACHHHTGPKHVQYEVRVACEFLAHMVSLLMSAKEDIENREYRIKLKSTQAVMVENISRHADFVSGFVEDSPNLLQFIEAAGAATSENGKLSTVGSTPSQADIGQIVQWLSTEIQEDVFATDCLSARFPAAEASKDHCAGLLALRFSNAKDDFLLWFRPETCCHRPHHGVKRTAHT